ncbi:MAG: hypothetical protein J6Z44_04680, partial [Bacteroidales bacterium]|nr:hypothetical protein [Bacteroidales bacterium]
VSSLRDVSMGGVPHRSTGLPSLAGRGGFARCEVCEDIRRGRAATMLRLYFFANRTPQFFIWELEYNFVFLHRLAKYGAIGT